MYVYNPISNEPTQDWLNFSVVNVGMNFGLLGAANFCFDSCSDRVVFDKLRLEVGGSTDFEFEATALSSVIVLKVCISELFYGFH